MVFVLVRELRDAGLRSRVDRVLAVLRTLLVLSRRAATRRADLCTSASERRRLPCRCSAAEAAFGSTCVRLRDRCTCVLLLLRLPRSLLR